MMNMSRVLIILALLLLTGCGSVLVSVEPVPFQYEELNVPADPPAKPTEQPESPLLLAAAAPMPTEFLWEDLVAALGFMPLPGTYTCEDAPGSNALLACEVKVAQNWLCIVPSDQGATAIPCDRE